MLHNTINNGYITGNIFNEDEDEPPDGGDGDRHPKIKETIIVYIDELFDQTRRQPENLTKPNKFNKINYLFDLYKQTKKTRAKQRNRRLYVVDSLLSASLFSIISALYW